KIPVVLTSSTSKTSKPPKSVIDDPKTSKHPKSNKPIYEVINTPPNETTSKLPDSPKPNEVSSAILLSRAQREKRLRKKAIELAEELEKDPKEYMNMKVQERLIKEEIIRHKLEDDGVTSSWLDTDKK
ncbi:hypothetical protein C1646_771991, partial [Rhizophagus diaphanus]